MSANLIELLREARDFASSVTVYDEEHQNALILVSRIDAALAQAEAQPKQGIPSKVYLVATGETRGDQELYTRHETPIPLCDYETLYTAPQPAEPAVPSVDWLASVIRAVDGSNSLGAGQLAEKIVAAMSTAAVPAVPSEPSPGLLMSMALRYDHGLGAPGYYDSIGAPGDHAKRLESTLRTMRKLWDEVAGQGFYMPEREAEYAALAAAPEVKL